MARGRRPRSTRSSRARQPTPRRRSPFNVGREGSSGFDMSWNWRRGFTIPDEILTRNDKQKAAEIMLEGIRSRAPVVTGRFKASLVAKVLKRTVNVRSKLRYMRKLNWDMQKKGAPFAYISGEEQDRLERIGEEALDRALEEFQVSP